MVSASQPVAEKPAEKPAAKETKAKEAPKPEPPKEEEEDGGMGGLFDWSHYLNSTISRFFFFAFLFMKGIRITQVMQLLMQITLIMRKCLY